MTQNTVARPVVTAEERDLIRRTVANGATAEELKLYLYDCARHGVHPLDRLLHFTKREGRYVPITSIDLLRTRAAETGEYAGSDDAQFVGVPGEPDFRASVTVWRIVQSRRCPFTATAWWVEYCPAPGPSGKADRMWIKMKHGQLSKCAEALALRKGFPQELAGLYAKEELDQAPVDRTDVVYTVTPTAPSTSPPLAGDLDSVNASPGDPASLAQATSIDIASGAALTPIVAPTRLVTVRRRQGHGAVAEVVTSESDEVLPIYNRQLAALCEQCCQEQAAVLLTMKTSTQGRRYLTGLTRIGSTSPNAPPAATNAEGALTTVENQAIDAEVAAREALKNDDIPF